MRNCVSKEDLSRATFGWTAPSSALARISVVLFPDVSSTLVLLHASQTKEQRDYK